MGFTLLLTIAAGGAVPTPAALAGSLVWTVAGGVVAGLLVAGGVLVLAARTEDHLVEITLTTIAAYGSFLLAEHFHMSGVLASLSAGLLVGNFGMMRSISESSRGHVLAFWEYAAFLANSVVFILIGGYEAHQHLSFVAETSAVAILLVAAGRALAVYSLCALFALSTAADRPPAPARPRLGRPPRSTGPRPRIGVAGGRLGTGGNHRCYLRRSRVFYLCAGAHHALAHSPPAAFGIRGQTMTSRIQRTPQAGAKAPTIPVSE